MDTEHETSRMAAKVTDIQQHNPADSMESRYMGAQITMIPEKVTFVRLEGAGHGTKEFSTPENLNRVFRLLDNYLK